MRGLLVLAFPAFAAAIGCAPDRVTSGEPFRFEIPPLESVPFDLVGNSKVAFERIGPADKGYEATYIIDAAARTSRNILDTGLIFGPSMSPDGRLIAFTRYSNNATLYDVHVAGIDGSNERQVSHFPQQEGPPSWSSDGSKVVIIGAEANTVFWDVYSQSPIANAGDLVRLSHFAATPGVPIECPIIIDNESRASVSSQSMIAFVCMFREVNVLSPTGDLVVAYKASRGDPANWGSIAAVGWSPDGSRVAFIETIADQATQLVSLLSLKAMDSDGNNVTTLASFHFAAAAKVHTPFGSWIGPNNSSLCWMPDGSRLVFNVPESELVGHLWVIRPDGSGLAQLTSAAGVWDRSVSCASA